LIDTVPSTDTTTAPPDPAAHIETTLPSVDQPEHLPNSLGEGSERGQSADELADDVSGQPEPPEQPGEETPPRTSETKAEPTEPGFAELGLSDAILRAVHEMGYLTPTPIQQQAIPSILMGRDVLGCAQTGTGKTAGFTLPMLDILSGSRARARMPRSLILEPTRELALQVAENFVQYGKHLKLTHALIIGGESMSDQKDLLMRGVDVLIATPGRLIDMFERGGMLLTQTSILVIDEADRMLDMGFIPDVERIVGLLPTKRQTLFFSATMAPEIRRLGDAFLNNPKEITVSKPASVATTITAGLVLVAEQDKREALRRLIRSEDVQNALIFCNRKRDVDILFKSLSRHGFSVGALHGDMVQPVRFATLEKFKANETRLLCCSDVAARGLDIGGLSHVFNFDVPIHAEDYVHRIGRTGRAGREGRALTIATPGERQAVVAIEKLTAFPIPRMTIDGLDVVDWSEDDGRSRRRGRTRAPARKPETRKPEIGKRDARKAENGSVAPAKPEPRPAQGRRSEPRKSEPRRDRADASRTGAVAHPAVEPAASPRHARPEPADRFQRRDRGFRRRDDEPGQSIVGFGDEVPAFMLVAARPRRHAASNQAGSSAPAEDAQ
jgi:superfamily II DNA/RNA helicase